MSGRFRAAAGIVAALTLMLATGCVRLPEEGPVVETRSTGEVDDDPGTYFDPRPPQADASPAEIVTGFLDAMTATPVQTNVARQFLASDLRASWDPERETITYTDVSLPRGSSPVSVTLSGADRLDARGAWQGSLPVSEQTMSFAMQREDGQWRITDAPNALIVPESWFEQRFSQVSLYFFDPTARILVPEPVFVPRGEQLATTLVEGLLQGPGRALSRVSRTFLPADLSVGLSVPVNDDGVAAIGLTGEVEQLSPEAVELMVAQLAWTLRQEASIEAFRVSIGSEQLRLPGGITEFRVTEGAAYDPVGVEASSLLYGLRDGLLVAGAAEALDAVEGPLGTRAYGVRSVAVNLTATTAAAVSADGTEVLVSKVRRTGQPVRSVAGSAVDLLPPAWDFADRLWLVDRALGAAQVSYREGRRLRRITVAGVTGRRVRSFLVSRDGSRLVAVVRRSGGDALMVSRIRHDDGGRVLGASRAVRIAWDGGSPLEVRDIAWRSATSLAVLHRVGEFPQVRTVSLDGAPTGLDSPARTLRDRVLGLAGSPVESQTLYAVTRTDLVDLSRAEGRDAALDPSLTDIGYVG